MVRHFATRASKKHTIKTIISERERMSQQDTSVLESNLDAKIQILPPHIVNKIAAGEVVERPASVVKELVENAIDAGASRIDIQISAGGRNIRVADNGTGMNEENAKLAFYNHATSKIQTEEDLSRIGTLGFRGEALASIASIAKVTCLTKQKGTHNESEHGYKITVNELSEPEVTTTGCNVGTIMEVSDLFYNTPARLKFLKRPATEIGHITTHLEGLALSNPDIQFSVSDQGKTLLSTSGSGDLALAIEEVFSLKKERLQMLPVSFEDAENGLKLTGFISEPGVMKSSRRWMIHFINGRLVKCQVINKAIETAFAALLPHGKYPISVLFLEAPTDEVDVNVHPTKKEVRYASSNSIFSFIKTGVTQSMSASGMTAHFEPVSEMNERTDDRMGFGGQLPPRQWGVSGGGSSTGSPSTGYGRPASGGWGTPPRTMSATPQESSQQALGFYAPSDARPVSEENPQPSGKYKVLSQLFNTYILLETVQGLMVVDQHIASERAWFEIFSQKLNSEDPVTQGLVVPLVINLSGEQTAILSEHHQHLNALGYQFTQDENTIELTGVPIVDDERMAGFDHRHGFETLLTQLAETGEASFDLNDMIATMACHRAVRAGDTLSNEDMETIIAGWLTCELPWTCPHGRPIAHTIATEELNHFFHRPSLPVNAV